MNKLALPLTALALTLAGCGTQSGSTAAGSAPTSTATTSTAPTGMPTTGVTASGAGHTTSSPPTYSGPAVVPPSATSATLTYVSPTSSKRLRVTKSVTGATYQRLAGDLNALQPMGSAMQCMVLTGEDATITLISGGHTVVYSLDGSPCRGVGVQQDGVARPRLAGSMTLTNQIRAIAGYTGMAHPLNG